jgi:DnaK suppressor protein
MAAKRPKKKSIVKTSVKKTGPAAKRSALKAKSKTSRKKKPVAKKPSGKKTLQKTQLKTPVKGKKTSSMRTKVSVKAPSRPVVKKTSVKTKQKTAPKKKSVLKKTPAKKQPLKTRKKPVQKAEARIAPPLTKAAVRAFEETRKAGLKKVLITRREQIIREVKSEISKYIKGETRQLVDTALDDGDWSVVDLSEDISLRQLSTHGETLRKIDEALRKVNEGTYGICEDCGEEISEERLKILPFAIYCIDCQEKREQFEEMERREGNIG